MFHNLQVFLLALPFFILQVAYAQTVLNEEEAIRQGLSRGDFVDLQHGRLQAAEADAIAAGQWTNPTLEYSREHINSSPKTTEQTWMLSQTFDVSGRRNLSREAARARLKAVTANNASRRLEMAAEIRRSFYAALFQQETIRATETWVQRFGRIESMIEKLTRAGEASGYDRRRLARELKTAEAKLAAGRAELDRVLTRLMTLTGTAATPSLNGELLPTTLTPVDRALGKLDQHPDLQALSHRAEAADLEGRSASRGTIPDVTVGLGPKFVDDGNNSDSGLVVSLSVPLPVFDRQQAGQKRAVAEALQSRAEYRLVKNHAEGELRGLYRLAEGLRSTAVDFRHRAVASSPDLLRIAEAAYQGGESSLLELLDAYRGVLESEITALELEKRARDARIEYDLLTGSIE